MMPGVKPMTEQHYSITETASELAASRPEFRQSQKLIRCVARSSKCDGRLRLVEMESFKLWEFLMTTKHGMKIEDPAPCLWVHSDEYDQKEAIYSHAANIERVNRIVVSIFDEYYNFSHIVNRFAYEDDTEPLIRVLSDHMKGRIDNGDKVDLFVVKGYCVERWHHAKKPPLVIGLSC